MLLEWLIPESFPIIALFEEGAGEEWNFSRVACLFPLPL